MSKKSNTLALPVNPHAPILTNSDSEYESETSNVNKSVSFIDTSGNITSRYSSYNDEENSADEESYESDNDNSSLLKAKSTSSGNKFSRKSTYSSRKSTGSTFGSRLSTIYRKSTSTIGNGLNSLRFTNTFSINRNKTLKKLLDTKTVGFAGGVTLLINGILGPGLIPTPQIFSVSGLVIPAFTFIFFAIFSTICAQFIVEAMQTIPGNKHFQGTVEFSTLINFYFGKKMHIIGQFILYMALQSANVSSIIYSAQTMDNFIINFFKRSCGVAANLPFFSNSTVNAVKNDSSFSLYCVDEMAKENSPFGDQFMLVTLGYIITFVCIFPVGFMKLQDNINMQIVSFSITVLVFTIWFVLFYLHGFDMNNVPLLSYNCKEVVGVVMFNFAFVTTIPSWINIKKKEVSVQKSLWTSTITSVILYIIIGYSAAITFKTEGTLNILSQLSSLNALGRITTYVFSIAILMVSIPTFSIIVRNNLVQNKICGYKTATFFSHVLPWICVLPFQTGTFINDVINWSSLLFVSTANFIIPIIIYLKCLKFKSESKPRRYFTPRQREILKTIHWSSKTIQGFIDSYPVSNDQNQENLNSNKSNNTNGKQESINSDNNSSSSETLNESNNDIPEIHLYTSNEKESKIVITEENAKQFLPPPPPVSRTASHSNVNKQYPISRFSTLPTHPLFISNYYKGIPSWIPFKPKTFALICLTIIMIIITAVIGLNVYQELDNHNILIYFNEDNSRANAIDALNDTLITENNKGYESSSKYNEDIYNSEKDRSENKNKNKNNNINANNTIITATTTSNNNNTKSINDNNYQAINNNNKINNNNYNNKFNNGNNRGGNNVYEPIEFNYGNSNNENKYNSDAYKSNRKENNGGNENERISQNGNERDDENRNENIDDGRNNDFKNNNDNFYDNHYINNNNYNDNFFKDNIYDNHENNHDYNHNDNHDNNHNNYDNDYDDDNDDNDDNDDEEDEEY